MDLFGFKKRKAQEEAIFQKAKNLKDLKFQKIKEEYAILKSRADKEADLKNKEDRDATNRHNNKCPKCGSSNVNDRIKRLQGAFEGEISGERTLFGGSFYGHSSGKLDTNEVNKCNDCNNEWKKSNNDWTYWKPIMEKNFERLGWVLEGYQKALTAKIDPKDLNEKYLTDADKKEALLKDAESDWRKKDLIKFFEGTSIETIKETAEREIWSSSYERSDLERFYKFWDETLLKEKFGIIHMQL